MSNGKEDADKLNDEDGENQPPKLHNSKKASNSNKPMKTSNSRKVSRYLTKNTLEDICNVNEKVSTMPILKNGSSLTLMSIAKEGKNVSVLLTCPHDSIFQLFLCAAFDYESLSTYMEKKKDHPFFQLVKRVVSRGVTRQIYELRADLLQVHFEGKEQPNNCIIVNCQTSAENMYNLLMQTTPSFVEITCCSRNCTDPRTTKLGIIHGEHSWFASDGHFQKMIEGNVIIRRKNKRECYTDGCQGFLETKLAETGRFIAVSIDSRPNDRIRLNDIPRYLQLTFMTQQYEICGMVNLYEPKTTRRSLDSIGHYTAISLRKNGTWIEYDDNPGKAKSLRGDFLAHPSVVVYANKTK